MTANVRKDPEVKELSISAQLKEVRACLNIKIGQGNFYYEYRCRKCFVRSALKYFTVDLPYRT